MALTAEIAPADHDRRRHPSAMDATWRDPRRQAFLTLRVGFAVAPIIFGLDKFLHVLSQWDLYLAPRLDRIIPGTPHDAMHVVGIIEIIAGLVVALWPRFGGHLVAAWLAGIIANLLMVPGFYDIALRDFGLLLGALALARLASAYAPKRGLKASRR